LFQDEAGRSAGAMTFATYLTELFWPCIDGKLNMQQYLVTNKPHLVGLRVVAQKHNKNINI
jgi:hypothetical protein